MSAEKEVDDKEKYKNVFSWPPLESNPESMQNYLYQLGLPKKYHFEEPFMILPEFLRPPHFEHIPLAAIACLEQIRSPPSEGKSKGKKKVDERPGDAKEIANTKYYMKQTGELDNACGIVACLHSIFNAVDIDLDISDEQCILNRFWNDARQMSPESRAELLENASDFKEMHKTAAMEGQSNLAEEQSDVKHHFVAFYLRPDGKIFELDGTKEGPAYIPYFLNEKRIVQNEKGEDVEEDFETEVEKVDKEDFMPAVGAELMRRITEGLISESLNVLCLVKEEENN